MTILRIQIGYQRVTKLNLSFMRMLVRACPKRSEMIGCSFKRKVLTVALKLNAPRQRCHGFAASKFLRDAIEVRGTHSKSARNAARPGD